VWIEPIFGQEGAFAARAFDGGGGGGASPIRVITGFVGELTFAEGVLYWTEPRVGLVRAHPLDSLVTMGTSAQTTTIASTQEQPTGIALDDGFVYWTNALSQTIRRCPRQLQACSRPEDVVTGQSRPSSMVVDARAIYWINAGNGTIMKVAKP